MNQFLLWAAGLLSMVYGILTALAGFGHTRMNKIQTWAAWGMVLCGLLVVAAGVLTLRHSASALWVLAAGLTGIHILAINNGQRMFGRINPSHHIVRLAVSIALLLLAYSGLK